MTIGLILASLSLATGAGTIASYYPKMQSNQATLLPRRQQALMVLALLLAISAFFLQPGIVGYVLGALAIVPAALFLLGTSTSGLPSLQPAVSVGALAPDFSAIDAEGMPFHLSNLRGEPVLIKFFRGYWCPYCIAELKQLDDSAKEFAALGIKLVALSSDRVDELRPFKQKQNWDITLLADPELVVHRQYRVEFRKFSPKRGPFRDLAIPTTILIDRDGRVLLLEQTSDFRVRPQASMILAKAKALLATNERQFDHAASCDVCAAIDPT
ncbi:peroxiredoxin family protein [Mesorhizobium qingshengii]|uniref:Peroxiredoxin n=1 Tax=Mesorhizobium qingshengii TaxID=1165689 RepID=A0A1G5WIC1_9HYPH|nr:redoxin domain-containing protein [Mesorhizobium qingshengii]SDA57931.1 Peroxiredoxin [Mesorhizobium qingshengii]